MNNLSFLLIFLTFLKLIHCLDPRLSFSMLIGNDDESASFENDKGYQNDAIVEINTDCRSADGRFFKDGNQFRTNKTCELCNCEKGSIKCFNQECPNLSCKQQVRLNGECCSICKSTYKVKNENLSCKLSSDVSYKAGAVWHPFIIPLGFDKCTICSCSVSFCFFTFLIFIYLLIVFFNFFSVEKSCNRLQIYLQKKII